MGGGKGTHRNSLNHKERRFIFQRDGFKCTKCGKKDMLEVHHIIPVSEGGTNEKTNLQTLCVQCHRNIKLPDKALEEENEDP